MYTSCDTVPLIWKRARRGRRPGWKKVKRWGKTQGKLEQRGCDEQERRETRKEKLGV